MKILYTLGISGALALLSAITPVFANSEINRLDNRIYRCDQIFKGAENISVMLILGNSNVVAGEIPAQDGTPNVVGVSPINGLCYPAKDPLMGTIANTGSPWTRLANKLVENHSYAGVMLIPIISPSNSITDWKQDGKIFKRVKQVVTSLAEQGIRISSVVWQHDQNNDAAVQQKEDYTAAFSNFAEGLRTNGVTAPIYVAKISVCPNHTSSPFYDAQKSLAGTNDKIIDGPDFSNLSKDNFVDGSCTLNKNGLETYVSSWVDILKK